MKIEFKELSEDEYIFAINDDEIGTVEKTILKDCKDGWVAIDSLDGLSCEGKTKKDAVKKLYYKIIESRLD